MLLLAAATPLSYNHLSKMPQEDAKAWCNETITRNVVLDTISFVDGSSSFEVDILQRVPVIAAVRGFASGAECEEVNRMTEHWISHPRSRHDKICRKMNCDCWYDVLMDHRAASLLVELNNRTARLLASLSSSDADYSRVQPPAMIRPTVYNAGGHGTPGEQAWCPPHCDSGCNGELLSTCRSARNEEECIVAVGMVSCRVAEAGGETSLSYGNVVFRPQHQGDLLLFGLKEDDERMDAEGRTEHAGCPVRKGEKSIVTIRLAEGDHAPLPAISIEDGVARGAYDDSDYFETPLPGRPLAMLKGHELLWRQQQREQQQHQREVAREKQADGLVTESMAPSKLEL